MNRNALLAALALSLSSPVLMAQDSAAPRVDILSQCPQLAEELPELLASAKQAIGSDGDVRVTLRVDAAGRLAVEHLSGTRAYRSPARIALAGLQCPGAAAQRYVLNIQFDDSPTALARAKAQTLVASSSSR